MDRNTWNLLTILNYSLSYTVEYNNGASGFSYEDMSTSTDEGKVTCKFYEGNNFISFIGINNQSRFIQKNAKFKIDALDIDGSVLISREISAQ